MLLIRKSLKFNLIKETMIRATSSFRIASMALISLALAGTVSSFQLMRTNELMLRP